MFAILWDNDGVLVDTEGLYFQACRETLENVDVELTLPQFQEISLQRGESTLDLAAQKGVPADQIARLREQRDVRFTGLLEAHSCVFDAAEPAVRALHGLARMGVVTSSQKRHFDAAHRGSGLVQYMDFVLTREDYTHSKPHPDPYLTALERYELQPDRCIVVEDSERGLAAAKGAGIDCIVVLSVWTAGGNFSDAVAVVPGIADVPAAVRKWMRAHE